MGLVATLGAWGHGQSLFELDGAATEKITPNVGGLQSIDLVPVDASMPGVALRHGNVVLGSEQIEISGRVLKRGRDYHMDAESGVVYLMVPVRQGDSLRAVYRYDTQAKPSSKDKIATALSGIRFDLVPGSMSMVLGLGMTERLQDGSVIRSNVYGLNNAFSLGGGSKLTGMYLVGDRQRTEARSGLEVEGKRQATDTGRSHFIQQQFGTKVQGGTFEVDYQDISQNFAGFQSVRGNNPNANVDQLAKEKGLTRQGYSLKDVGLGFGKFSQSYRTVSDDKGALEWRTLGFQSGGLTLNWDSRKVDEKFARFKDIAEGDRAVLQNERGIERENLGLEFKDKTSGLKYNARKIEDFSGNGIFRRDFELNVAKSNFRIGDQHVEKGFTKFGGLMDAEKGQWAREQGLRRQWVGVETALFGTGAPIKYALNKIKSDDGEFQTAELLAKVGPFSLETSTMKMDDGFKQGGSMRPDEIAANLQKVGKMYQPGGLAFKGNEAGQLVGGFGLDRQLTRISGEPFKGWNLRFDALELKGKDDGATVGTLAVGNKDTSFSYRNQRSGDGFAEFARLTDQERIQLGAISGLDRLDMAFAANLRKFGKVGYASTVVSSAKGDVHRTETSLQGKSLDVKVITRDVDPGFDNLRQLVDPEKDLLYAIRGFNQRDIVANWKILPNLTLNAYWFDAKNDTLEQQRYFRSTKLDYALDKKTQFGYTHIQRRDDDPANLLFAQDQQILSIKRDLGRLGTVSYVSDTIDYEGKDAKQPDVRKTYVGWETKLDKTTGFKTEQIRTDYENGDKENVSANTVSKELSKRVGVSVTDVSIDRQGEDKDERKRTYGFWYDFGKNIRLKYGVDRHLKGEAGGATLKSDLSISPGQAGGIQIDSATYNRDRVDETQQDRHVGNVQFGTVKPVNFGSFRDFTFRFSADTDRNQFHWLKENRDLTTAWKLGSTAFGFAYKSQVHQSGYRGIDRKYWFNTDTNPKARLVGGVEYKIRTLPAGDQIIVRNYNLTYRPAAGIELSHQVQTNPEVAKGDAILGSVVKASQSLKWRLGFERNPNTKFGFSWEELLDRDKKFMSRIGGMDLQLFAKSGSPLSLFYGVEQKDQNGKRQTQHRYHLRFDQKPGPNQMFSIFAGNVAYEHSIAEGFHRNNWTIYLNYQIKL